MIKIVLFLGLLALLPPVEAAPGKNALIYRVLIPLESVELVFDVVQDVRDGVGFRKTRLSCVGNCDSFTPISEETLDHILSVQFDSDDRNLMFVTWVTGSAYRIQAFSVSSRGFEAQLDLGSKALPAVSNFSGQLVLTVLEPEGKSGDSCLRAMQWNGSAFVLQDSAGLCAPIRYQACR